MYRTHPIHFQARPLTGINMSPSWPPRIQSPLSRAVMAPEHEQCTAAPDLEWPVSGQCVFMRKGNLYGAVKHLQGHFPLSYTQTHTCTHFLANAQ